MSKEISTAVSLDAFWRAQYVKITRAALRGVPQLLVKIDMAAREV